MKRIEFGELRITDRMRENVKKCLDSGWLTTGKVVKDFEYQWRNLFNYRHARAVSSGTTACQVSLLALQRFNIPRFSEVIVPSLSFIATFNACRMAEWIPVFVDCKYDLQIDETQIESAITDKTKAIMVPPLMGVAPQLDIIQEIAKRHNLWLIIDNAEGYSLKFKGKYALEYADMETASFFTGHMINAVEMGAISTNNAELDWAIASCLNHGRNPDTAPDFIHEYLATNGKPTDLHASIGLATLDEFLENFTIRRKNIQFIRESVRGFEEIAYFTEEAEDCINAPHGFAITMKPKYAYKFDGLKKALNEANIHFKKTFGSFNQHAAYKGFGGQREYPVGEYIGRNSIHIGVHRYLTQDDLTRITSCLKNFFKGIS